MTLKQLLDEAEQHRTEITVHAPEPWPELAELLDRRNVDVRYEETTEDESDGYIVVRRNGQFQGAVSIAAAQVLEEPPVSALDESDDERFSYLVSMLVDAIFRAFDRRQLLATSREFEDRAWRVGEGTLHAGFQRREAFLDQRKTYGHLAGRGDLDVHVYVPETWEDDPDPAATFHADDTAELRETWFVVFDGGGDDDQACALVAVEREDGIYEGCWTYEPDRVFSLDDYLRRTYWSR